MGIQVQNIQSLRENIKKELHGLYPEREIHSIMEILITYRLGLKRHEISLNRNANLEPGDVKWFTAAINKLCDYCPIQYVTGCTHFMGMPLKIEQGVLIPRPETEELVDWLVRENKLEHPRILDIGTGSGCIALALKRLIPGSLMVATDIKESALALAAENARRLNLEVRLIKHDIHNGSMDQDLFELDVIVSNPPYIPDSDRECIEKNVLHYEPHDALFVPDRDPLVYYRLISLFSRSHLKRGGILYFEIHENSGQLCSSLMEHDGFSDISIRRDLNGRERMLRCIKP